MKILICYFSGTGNTRKVAEKYASTFAELGHEAELVSVDGLLDGKTLPEEFLTQIENADLIGFGYPVHAFNAPAVMLKLAKKLPRLTSAKRAFVFNTSGEPLRLNNISSIKFTHMIKRRKYTVFAEYHYCMPYNIIFRHTDEMAYRMWKTAQQLIPLDVKQIVELTPHTLKRVACGAFIAWVMRCEHWGARLNGTQYKIKKQCVHCQKCVNICPTHNIKISKNGTLKFGKNCLMCMRCAQLCPKDAIKTGWFNKWKVNGAYTFEQPTTAQEQKYNKMLTIAYDKYFAECEDRIMNEQ
ncbi:MAG: EFR1 family ferrodoxin [Clostridiales bacterium]|nr:EFR1 family ferrodoxin [Clostridiales bacterium]